MRKRNNKQPDNPQEDEEGGIRLRNSFYCIENRWYFPGGEFRRGIAASEDRCSLLLFKTQREAIDAIEELKKKKPPYGVERMEYTMRIIHNSHLRYVKLLEGKFYPWTGLLKATLIRNTLPYRKYIKRQKTNPHTEIEKQ